MDLIVIYNTDGVQGFLDAADASSIHDLLMGNYPGCSQSTNAISVAGDTMVLPHEVGVTDGVASILEGDALEASRNASVAARKVEDLRKRRDAMLLETDWWVLPDRTATQEQLDYRQALRDITDTYTSLDDVVWPTKPE